MLLFPVDPFFHLPAVQEYVEGEIWDEIWNIFITSLLHGQYGYMKDNVDENFPRSIILVF